MSSAKTGLWSAFGALVGGFTGAMAGKYMATTRPRVRYATAEPPPRRGARGSEVEDAMVIGAGAGAVLGAFVAGAVAGEDAPPTPPALGT
jgi:hypothetical protein